MHTRDKLVRMKNGLGGDVNGPTRPSVTLPKSVRESCSGYSVRAVRIWRGLGDRHFPQKNNGLGRDVGAGLKPLAQCVEALRAGTTSRIYSTSRN
jgi:hypothetical protein